MLPSHSRHFPPLLSSSDKSKLASSPELPPLPRHPATTQPRSSRDRDMPRRPPVPLPPSPLAPPLQSQQQPPHPSKPVLTPPPPALVVVVPKDKFTTSGPIKKWKGTADSGNAVYRWFCSECGSPIAHDPEAAPVIAIKGGTLDVEIKKGLKPVSFFSFFLWSLFEGGCADVGTPTGYRDLDGRQAPVLPGEAGASV